MDEFEFIDSIKQKTYKQKSLIKGIGDDAAVFRASTEDIVTAVDTFVENIHFSKKTTTSFQVGYRALAANISDMAAMGAIPKFYLVSIVIPSETDEKDLKAIFAGMKQIASSFHMDLIGGDTVSGEQLTISITVIGFVSKDKARYRSDAEDKDIVFVTGTLGDSRAGLHLLMNDLTIAGRESLTDKHQMPTPRVNFAKYLQRFKRVALNDISDGLANELREIAEASEVNIVIEDDNIPISDCLKQFTLTQQDAWKYFGGEDFELVGTVPQKDWDVIKQDAEKFSIRVTNIGTVTESKGNSGQVYVKKDNIRFSLEKEGYIHLKQVKE